MTAHTVTDTTTMLRRELLHQRRYPSITLLLVGMPVVVLLLFVYVFGDALGAGISGSAGRRDDYLDFVTPGILLMAVAAVAQGTSISVATDMTEGIVARFRTMSISRTAVLTGHVLGALVQTTIGLAVVMACALAIGFRPEAGATEWLAAAGTLAMVAVALTWLCVGIGMLSSTVEAASNLPMPLLLLPVLGNAFVPTETLPVGVRWFAEHQPFTAFTDTLRGLLLGTPIGTSAAESAAWCLAITAVGFLVARTAYERRSLR